MKLLNRAESGLLFEALVRDHTLLFPVRRDNKLYLATSDKVGVSEAVVGEVRTVDPLKALFFLGREKVAEGFRQESPEGGPGPFLILGAKACDLQGFGTLDKIFLDPEYGDPTYRRLRESSLIISSDCTCAIDTCFCVAAGGRPWPEEGFDLNLSPVDDGFVVEEGSEKGREIIRKHAGILRDPSPEQLARRSGNREAVAEQVRGCVASSGTPDQSLLEGMVMKRYESTMWAEEASTCVECGACNTVCPTCHCFFLYDCNGPGGPSRFRAWDSCLIKDFARVAGGANPRRALWMRLRNRFEKKFDFFRKVAGQYACTGCGRCISACPGKIDIRRVLKRLVNGDGQ
jgi:sulfhydrogenase subunit beta (sulfur reductase)